VHPRRGEAVVARRVDAGLLGHVLEGAVRALAVERVALALEAERPAEDGEAAELAGVLRGAAGAPRLGRVRREVFEVEGDVAGDEEVEAAVAVEVAEARARRPAPARDAEPRRHVRERAVAVVAVEARDAVVADEEVCVAVVVEVGGGHAHPPALVGDAGPLGHVLEPPAAEVAEERGPRRLLRAALGGHRRAVEEVDVGAAVAVVVEDGDAARGRLDDVVLRRPARAVAEGGEARARRHVLEDARRPRVRHPGRAPRGRDEPRARRDAHPLRPTLGRARLREEEGGRGGERERGEGREGATRGETLKKSESHLSLTVV
jgi:hypothetical protein